MKIDRLNKITKEVLADEDGWLVGGTVRDELLERPTDDLDIVVKGSARKVALELAIRVSGSPFLLSKEWDSWRVVLPNSNLHLDILPLQGETIEEDLSKRDFTVNAIAKQIASDEYINPFHGQRDLEDGVLRAVSESSFKIDPLRVVRLARFHCEIGFIAEVETIKLAKEAAPLLSDVATERIFSEFKRIVASEFAVDGIHFLYYLDALEVIAPELWQLKRSSPDNYQLSLEMLSQIQEITYDLNSFFPEKVAVKLERVLNESRADGLTTADLLKIAALFHHLGSSKKQDFTAERFAELANGILKRLRTSTSLRKFVKQVVRYQEELLLLDEKYKDLHCLYRYLDRLDPYAVEITLFTFAKRLTERNELTNKEQEKIIYVIEKALNWHYQGRPQPLIRGDELAEKINMKLGPQIAYLLKIIEEAQYCNEVIDKEQALLKVSSILDNQK